MRLKATSNTVAFIVYIYKPATANYTGGNLAIRLFIVAAFYTIPLTCQLTNTA
jgi:hypothetical protein